MGNFSQHGGRFVLSLLLTVSLFIDETYAFRNARQMSRRENSALEDPSHLFRTKTAVFKLLEQAKAEKPSIDVISKPSEPVASRKSRFKFPDPKKDCFVNLKVSSCNGKLCLPLSYENPEEGDQHFCGGLRYTLQVLSVNRFSLDGKQLTAGEPIEEFYCCSPLSAHKKGSAKKFMGFWFRFFGQEAVFRITVVLKIDVLYLRNLLGRKHLSDSTFYEDDGIIVKQEVEIPTRVKSPPNTAASERNGIINSAKIFPSLYLSQEYKTIIAKLKDLRQKLHFNELDKYFVQLLEKVNDSDLKVVLFLEQSQEACRKKLYEKSKLLLKQAVDATAKGKNKTLLLGRAYLYLSYVHQKDGCLGNAEECLAIARKKLQALEACEDVGDLCFQEGVILTNFAQKMPKFSPKLINEAKHKFEQAAAVFSNGLAVDDVLDKQCFAYIRLASLLLQQKPEALNTDESSTQNNTVLANKHLEWVAGQLSGLSERTKFHFHVCHTELLYKKRQFAKAKESLDAAFQIAKTCQFEEQAMWKEIPVKSCDKSYVQEVLSDGETTDKEQVDVVLDDVPSGYLGDISS